MGLLIEDHALSLGQIAPDIPQDLTGAHGVIRISQLLEVLAALLGEEHVSVERWLGKLRACTGRLENGARDAGVIVGGLAVAPAWFTPMLVPGGAAGPVTRRAGGVRGVR